MGSGVGLVFVNVIKVLAPVSGGTDLERGYGDVRPWRPHFHTSHVVRKGPILTGA